MEGGAAVVLHSSVAWASWLVLLLDLSEREKDVFSRDTRRIERLSVFKTIVLELLPETLGEYGEVIV